MFLYVLNENERSCTKQSYNERICIAGKMAIEKRFEKESDINIIIKRIESNGKDGVSFFSLVLGAEHLY